MNKITVLGLGAMGSRMAINLSAAGHDVTVWNRTQSVAAALATEKGLSVAETPRSAVKDAEFVVSMLRDDDAALAVWHDPEHGAFAAMNSGAVVIESSTLTPTTIETLAEAALDANVRFVEAPVVGSRPQADAGALFYLLSGEAEAVEAAQPIIDVNAGNSKYVGEIGNAATMKLAINGLFAAQVAAFAEMTGFIEQSSLDTAEAMETLAALPITSPGLQRVLGLMQERNYSPNFPVHLVAKDLGYLTKTAQHLKARLPIAEATHTIYQQAAAGDQRDLDIAGIAQLYQT